MTRKPRILYITPGCFDKGGISRYCRYQIRAFRELYGSENIRVYSLLGPTNDGFEVDFDVTWHGAGANLRSKAALVTRAAQAAIAWRPDVIVIAHVNFSAYLVPIAKMVGAISIINTYGLEVWSNPSIDALWGLRNAGNVLSDCYATRDYLEKESRLRPLDSCHVIWDCVDLDRFHPGVNIGEVVTKYGIPDPNRYLNILTLGRLVPDAMHKGYDRLLEVFKKICNDFPDSRLVIAGRGSARSTLEENAFKLGISKSVVFTGSIDENDLPSVYRSAAVFSLVSDRGNGRGEGLPLTPLEAMACGVPVIVGNQDGSREAIADDKNGFAIDPFDLSEHASKIVMLLQQPKKRRQMGDAAVEVAHRRFSFDSFRDRNFGMIQSILNR